MQKTKNKPTHRIGEIFNELVGHTTELKISFREKYGLTKDVLDFYCRGRKKRLEAHHIEFFLDFFNLHKHPDRNAYELKDLYESSESDSITSKINLK